MTIGGWINLIVSVGVVVITFGWCIWKVFRTPGEEEQLHGFEIEPPDLKK